MSRYTILAASLVAATCFGLGTAQAGFTDFESFAIDTSVNGQGDWTVEDSFGNSAELFDEEVVDDGSGNNVWRISNAITSSSVSNQPNSTKSAQVAGETGAGLYNDYGVDHTMPNNPPLSSATATTPYFHFGVDFKSATGAAQPGLGINLSAGAAQSTLRNSYVRIVDNGATGFDLEFVDTEGASTFNFTPIPLGLNYTDWHSLDVYVKFEDGVGPGVAGSEAGNDLVRVVVNGSLVHAGTTWESYFYNAADSGPAGVPRAVDTITFQARGTAAPGTSGAGLYFDNVLVDNAAQIPEPGSIALCGLAGLFGTAVYLRRRWA